jgi:hypothetical protein
MAVFCRAASIVCRSADTLKFPFPTFLHIFRRMIKQIMDLQLSIAVLLNESRPIGSTAFHHGLAAHAGLAGPLRGKFNVRCIAENGVASLVTDQPHALQEADSVGGWDAEHMHKASELRVIL